MSCKDCQCSKSDQALSESVSLIDISDKAEPQCTCSSCNPKKLPEQSPDCPCRRPPGRSCRCCPCRSCCSCCSCCSSSPRVCKGSKGVGATACTWCCRCCSCCSSSPGICAAKKEDVCQSCAAKREEAAANVCKSCAGKAEPQPPKKGCASCGCAKCA